VPWEIADFDDPMDERGLLVLARGSASFNIARVSKLPDLKDLMVSVSVNYSKEKALSDATVCFVEREDGSHGIVLSPSVHVLQ
jgi:hypothetical protein